MADSTDTAAAASSSAPKPEPKRSWGDEVDDEEAVDSKSGAELDVDGLAIDENKKINKFLDEPEDSNIKAVRSLFPELF